MDIFCCRISNLIAFLFFIYCILVVRAPVSSRKQECYNKLHEVFRTENKYEENLTKLFQYAILNLRYIKPSDLQGNTQNIGSSSHGSSEQSPQPMPDVIQNSTSTSSNQFDWKIFKSFKKYIQNIGSTSQGDSEEGPQRHNTQNIGSSSQGSSQLQYIQNIGSTSQGDSEEGPQRRLLFDGNEIGRESHICNNEYAFVYYEILANLFQRGRAVSTAKAFCNELPDTPMYKEDRKDCKDALLYFGFTAENQEDIIRYAYSEIVLDDITSDRRFRDDMEVPNQKRFAIYYLQQIAKEVNVNRLENKKDTPYSFCQHIDNRLPVNK